MLIPSLRHFVSIVDKLNDWIGKTLSMLVFPMIFFLVWEVVLRYVFNRPTIWAHELSAMLYAVFFLLGGSYALRHKAHINVDILYMRLTLRARAILDLITWTLFYFVFCIMLWQGTTFAKLSIMRMEHSNSVWEPPIWPIKLCIPIGAFLILLQGLTKTFTDISIAFTGHDVFHQKNQEKKN